MGEFWKEMAFHLDSKEINTDCGKISHFWVIREKLVITEKAYGKRKKNVGYAAKPVFVSSPTV